jgi:hypothetical protein
MPEYEGVVQNIKGRIFQEFCIHFVDSMTLPQELDVVREEHDACKDHVSGW